MDAEWLKQIAAQGPVVLVMGVALLTVWRRYERVQDEIHKVRDRHQEHLDTLSERQRITTDNFAQKTIEMQTKFHDLLVSMLDRRHR